ncbi:hypothetical protein PAXRUDRAFT_835882 [Paxillus rubicundulus Ve08.2h10]|uniref:Uncharacterized protein n=1 Tax=Paxillus rubicundulus Ve08.2h10 TaxID=930991 RepID=A0A0D0DC52_9AGAM|nr:hypothetical protein PAXRUDRAFT_835882 [Paxillus rubicundulus Ve08.2h10]
MDYGIDVCMRMGFETQWRSKRIDTKIISMVGLFTYLTTSQWRNPGSCKPQGMTEPAIKISASEE